MSPEGSFPKVIDSTVSATFLGFVLLPFSFLPRFPRRPAGTMSDGRLTAVGCPSRGESIPPGVLGSALHQVVLLVWEFLPNGAGLEKLP